MLEGNERTDRPFVAAVSQIAVSEQAWGSQLAPVSAIAQCSYGSSTESQLQRCRAAVAEQLVEKLLDAHTKSQHRVLGHRLRPARRPRSFVVALDCSSIVVNVSEMTVMLGTRLDIAAWESHRHKNVQWPFERQFIAFRLRAGVDFWYILAPSKGYHTTTYLEHLRRTKCLASALSKWGVKLEDRVATLMWNTAWHYE